MSRRHRARSRAVVPDASSRPKPEAASAAPLPLPSSWTTSSGISISPAPQMISAVQELVTNTWRIKYTRDRKAASSSGKVPSGARVLNVLRVENHDVYQRYARRRLEMKAAIRPDIFPVRTDGFDTTLEECVNEKFFFHGTNPVAADSIARTDFDMDRAGSAVGTMFGPGLYLAENASKSDEYAKEGDGIFVGQCALLLCRALAGRVFTVQAKGDQSRAVKSGQYDSVCGDRLAAVGTFREMIFFSSDSVYCEYIILYAREFGDVEVGRAAEEAKRAAAAPAVSSRSGPSSTPGRFFLAGIPINGGWDPNGPYEKQTDKLVDGRPWYLNSVNHDSTVWHYAGRWRVCSTDEVGTDQDVCSFQSNASTMEELVGESGPWIRGSHGTKFGIPERFNLNISTGPAAAAGPKLSGGRASEKHRNGMRNQMVQTMKEVMTGQNRPLALGPDGPWQEVFFPIFDRKWDEVVAPQGHLGEDWQPVWDVLWQPVWNEMHPLSAHAGAGPERSGGRASEKHRNGMRNQMVQTMKEVMTGQNRPLALGPDGPWQEVFFPIFDRKWDEVVAPQGHLGEDWQPVWDVLWQPVWNEMHPLSAQELRNG
eukprot:TRINITY_DN8197_c0_g2_i1.p1 TRINITY_DN8197_c0_g2~~TRINITY_DN8197_c0_g2_i1.p1  ORF type:complete len:595 (+),score=68.26 TRINITY_DN8197_c0_g2_i1:109-1893(+)